LRFLYALPGLSIAARRLDRTPSTAIYVR